MRREVERLADYCHDRIGDSLRAVGYHTDDDFDVVFIREDLIEHYPAERVDNFIRTSRSIHADIHRLDDRMGPPEASLHVLEDGLAIQFHRADDVVVFVTMDQGVGRNFIRFVDECLDQIQ